MCGVCVLCDCTFRQVRYVCLAHAAAVRGVYGVAPVRRTNTVPSGPPTVSSVVTSSTSGVRETTTGAKASNGEPLSGVVVVVSGIGDPRRAKLKRMATTLGASYKRVWDDSATHLLCPTRERMTVPKFLHAESM